MTRFDSPSSLDERGEGYGTLNDDIAVPLAFSAIEEAAAESGVSAKTIADAAQHHQADLHADGTVFAYVKRLVVDGECEWIYCSDTALYLAVSESTWEREWEWFDGEADEFETVKNAHHREVQWVEDNVAEHQLPVGANGYAIGIDFPVASVIEDGRIDGPVLSLGERYEFLRRDVGIDRSPATTYTLYEWMVDAEGASDAEAKTVAADVTNRSEERVSELIEEVVGWEERVRGILEGIDGTVESSAEIPDKVFGTVAAIRNQ